MIKIFSIICAVNFFFNALLHLSLVLGAPFGEFVLGGQYTVFPMKMRVISVIFFFIWTFVGLLYLIKGNIIKYNLHKTGITIILLLVTIFMVYAIFGNLFITTSIKEKYLMTPLALVTSISSIFLLIIYLKKKNG
jgi:hypothetical protein